MKRSLRSNTEMEGCCQTPTTSFKWGWKTVVFLSMFVFWSAGSAFAQTACEPSIDLTCPESVTVSCDDVNNLELTGSPVAILNDCSEEFTFDVTVTSSDEFVSGNACSWTIMRTWVAYNTQLEVSASCTQIISVVDNEGPVFEGVEDITVQCIDDVVMPSFPSVSDACGEVVTTETFESHTGDITNICSLLTPLGPGPDGSIWLFDAQGQGLAASNFWSWIGTPSFEEYGDGTAHLVGDVVNNANASQGWHVDMHFVNKRDWATWSGLGRSYKNDLGLAGSNYLNWDYYELKAGFSTLTGFGSYAGNTLYLSHQPSNYYFGFQSGIAANNRNANDGMSGWFYYNGWYNGQWRSGHGDLFTEKVCEPQNPSLVCDDEVTFFYRAVDACGNASTEDIVVTVHDDIAPVIENCPESFTVECSDEVPAAFEGLTATDNCDDDVTIVYLGETTSAIDACTSQIIRTWYAADDCDNRTFCEQTITIVDTTAPEFTYVPENVTFECDEDVVFEDAMASDNCHEVSIIVESYEYEGECPNEYFIYRTFIASDGCGNYNYAYQTISVVDTTAPVFDPFEIYIAVECTEVENVPAPTATDNCSDVVTVEISEELLNSGGCLGVIERHYTATDACGNSTETVMFISILDTTPPVINTPEDMTVECDNVPSMPAGSGYDNCGYDVTVTGTEEIIPGDCENSYTIVWHWTAVDYCENVSTSETHITVVDTTDPVLSNVPESVTIECSDEVPAVVLPTATDNCAENLEVSVTEETTPGECDGESTITRIFRVFDNCGNSAMAVQYIYIQDTTAPVFEMVGESVTIECDAEIPAAEWVANDNCSDVTVSVNETSEEGLCYSTISRVYVAVDDCGNEAVAYQTITIVDTTAPVITGTFEIERPCDDYAGIFISYEDNCNEVSVDYTDEHVSGGCQGRVIRTYYVSDACQNMSTFQQYITLTDNVAPVVTYQTPDATFECGGEWPTPVVEFADNCAEELSIVTGVFSVGSCPEIITYTYTATDNCNNSTTVNVVYTIEDTTAPTVYAPYGGQFSCDEEIVYGMAEAWDVCSDVQITYSDEVIAGNCEATYTIVRTWMAEDACGNIGYGYSNYYVSDWTAPVWNEENVYELTFECTDVVAGVEPTATDNCSEFTIAVAETLFVAGPCYTSGAFIYTATDACGNVSAPFYQYFQILDTTAPVITGEFEITKPCDDYAGIFISYEDNCNEVSVDYSDEHVSGGCQGRVIRTYYVTDACENMSTFQQYITLTDEVAPVVTYQTEDATFECGSEWPTPVVEFADNCAEELTYASSVVSEGSCPEVITYTFSATDNCDNTTTVNVVYTIVDTTAPMVYAPYGGQFSCDEEIYYGMAEAWDACSDVQVTYSDETFEGECEASYSIVRTWMAEDACGNIGYGYTTYYVSDWTAPILEIPADTTIECDAVIPMADYTVSDNCSSVDVEINEMQYEYECFGVIEREYVATDACGNSTWGIQTITIVDTTAPVVEGIVEIERPCTDYMGTYITATDNCNTFEIEFVDEHVSGGCQGRIIRDYTVTDLCGNASYFQQIITLTDEVAPVAEVLPQDMTIECTEEVPGFTPSWSDNCDDELELSAISAIAIDGCTEIISRSWTATDNCGNSTTISQVITIVDTQAPMFDGDGYSMTVNCDEEWSVEQPWAWDACHDVTVAEEVETIAGNCEASYTEVHTFVATDECGNESAPFVVTVNVVDNTVPYWTYVPYSNEISCDAEIPSMMAEASDACSAVTVTSSEEIIAGNCESSYTLVRTFYAVDACGNEAEPVSVSYYIYDNQAPVIETELSDIYVECPMDIVPVEIAVSDNCSEVSVDPAVETIWMDECGNGMWQVSYYVVDACGNATGASYYVNVYDETAPVLSETPANLVLDCSEELPAAPEVSAMDNCNGEVEVEYTETIVGEMPAEGSIADCDLITPVRPAGNSCGYPVDWAMVLFGMPSAHRYYSVSNGELVQYPDGTIHIVATLNSTSNPSNGFYVDVVFANGMDWASWSTQSFPTGFKADCGGEGANHEDWMYYILQNGEGAELVGFGQYEGSAINLMHAPSSNYFGFQLGDGANNYNGADNGFGGWFSYNGVFLVNGDPIFSGMASGGGDFAFELDCCPDYSVVRTWFAKDCSNNVVTHTQTISWEGNSSSEQFDFSTAETATVERGKLDIVNIYPNPTNNLTEVKFVSEIDNQVTLDVLDATGRVVAKMYSGNVDAGTVYKFALNTDNFNNGLYQVRLTSLYEVATKQLQVIK